MHRIVDSSLQYGLRWLDELNTSKFDSNAIFSLKVETYCFEIAGMNIRREMRWGI